VSTARREAAASASGALGVATLVALAVGNLVLWVAAAPPGQPTGRFLGEMLGAEAVLLFSCALVLATILPPIERAFGGLDRVALWHRRAAEAGVLLLVPHIVLATSAPDRYATSAGPGLGDLALIGLGLLGLWALAPSLRASRWPGLIRRMAAASYERWLTAHRLTGLFVIAAVAHGALVAPTLHHSTLLKVVFLTIGGVGTLAYLYRELLARYFIPLYEYSVSDVRRLNDNALELSLEPTGEPLAFAPGQFVFIELGGPGAWQRHPFSVSSSPSDRRLELTIKASGDYTSEIFEKLTPGVPAKVAGPFGGFDYRQGGREQVWIAGGIGVTPFMSWIRSIDGGFDREISFYYSVAHREDALYIDEIRTVAAQHPSLRVHLVCAETDGMLKPADVLSAIPPGVTPWVYMCGPPPMMKSFATGLHAAGISRSHVRWEQFAAR
jgi:predicted ferric reductase